VNAAIAKTRQDFDVPLIFVGYGIQNRDEHWDDFKGLDLHGKLLLALAGEPGQTDKEPGRFEGASLTYQARPSYKFEEARKRGALGVLLVHTEAGAGSGWDAIRPAWVGERFRLAKDEGLALEGWISEEGAKMILKAASLDLRALQAKAENRDFKPVKVPVRMKGILNSEARRITESNVAGLVLGTDAQLKDDLIIYSSHWDHLGIHRDEKGQTIYPGARDNATGISALLAMSEFAAQHPMKRSQLFLFTCGEEQGLLGAFAYTQDPLFPLERTAACINMDTLNVLGATRDLGAFGAEHSDLADLSAQAAKIIGVLLRPPQPDPWGGFFRMDHFPFVKVGVPSISVTGGYDYVKDPEGTRKKAQAYGRWYHQASDRYDPTWNLSGALQQAEFALELGRRISEAPALPTWKPGDPYGVLRKK
jgi:Zn-dependent M28 family amino/carboxypeptidase